MDTNNGSSNGNSGTSVASYASHTPTQAMGGRGGAGRRRKPRKPRNNAPPSESRASAADASGNSTNDAQKNAPQKNDEKKKNQPKNKRRNRNARVAAQPQEQAEGGSNPKSNEQDTKQPPKPKSNNNNKKKPRKNNKKFPWRRHIPSGTVDPITLDPLVSLPYPPFALVATPPYTPVEVWPVPEGKEEKEEKPVDIEAVNRKRLEEQWGGKLVSDDGKPEPKQVDGPRHYHLYDGRALAFYLVSQLQFIDPLNRRDLTRDELVGLDSYLRRHSKDKLKVVDAYDAKGITLSSAGAAAHTAQGRAEILQQTAQNMLNSLFGQSSVAAPTQPRPTRQQNSLQERYAEIQRMEQDRARQQEESRSTAAAPENTGVYGSFSGGLMVIDDDENPGLRGDAPVFRPGAVPVVVDDFPPIGNPGYLARAGAPPQQSGESFPALGETASASATETTTAPVPRPKQNQPKKPAKPSKTLSRITGAVKKTSQAERQRQWEAREAARKKALVSNLSFGVDPRQQVEPQLLSAPSVLVPTEVSEEKLERNRSLAQALGVAPATMRQNCSTSWARPTTHDEFDNELQATIYPDSFMQRIRDGGHLPLILKLERKWNAFLADPKAPSLSLFPMDRKSRSVVHEYAENYRLRTESFDPEPKRYVHCAKMLDTRAPHPLASVAVRNWKGPSLATVDLSAVNDVRVVDGIELPIRPRGEVVPDEAPEVRPKLELDPLPPDLKPQPSEKDEEENLIRRRREREQAAIEKRRLAEKKKERALRRVFADDSDEFSSSSEEEDDKSDDSSVWEESDGANVIMDEEKEDD